MTSSLPQGAIFHGLATLLSQPSPVPSRGGPNPQTTNNKPKSVSYGILPDNPNDQPTYQNNPAFPMAQQQQLLLQRPPGPFPNR